MSVAAKGTSGPGGGGDSSFNQVSSIDDAGGSRAVTVQGKAGKMGANNIEIGFKDLAE